MTPASRKWCIGLFISTSLQPQIPTLYRSVFGPFKKCTNTACNVWMTMHSGSTMTIYNKTGIVSNSFPLAPTLSNKTTGFKKTENQRKISQKLIAQKS